eukprot:GILK01003862.1.p1 GENE.GILK01003862.1~~GILK01003862.1.p1  ORF type:complete len:537 (-),score=97.84 GILK01003862.1:229-1788(-)
MGAGGNECTEKEVAMEGIERKGKKLLWKEVRQHNTASSCWLVMSNRVYDVTEFLDRHPGGRDMLLISAGRDATTVFDAYHPFTDAPKQYLDKFYIGYIEDSDIFPPFSPDRSGFYATLKQRVKQYLEDNKIDPKDIRPGLIKLAGMLAVAMMCYSVMHQIFGVASWPVRIFAAAVFGVFQALPLLHAMHDASHASLGHASWGWKAIGQLCMEWYAGASLRSWQYQHVVGHHIYTNVMGADPDMPVAIDGDLRRLVPRQKWANMYRYQAFYLPILYGLLALKFRIQDFVDTHMSETNGPILVNPTTTAHWVQLITTKIFWMLWRLVAPIAFFHVPVLETLVLFCISELVTGWYLAFNFQVSHISESIYFPDMFDDDMKTQPQPTSDDAKLSATASTTLRARNVNSMASKTPSADKKDPHFKVGNELGEWAVVQVETSVDYSHGSAVTAYLAGALNYQVVHHLFPCVSQYVYPAIAPIVKQTCDEFGVKYRIAPSFWAAFSLHLKLLWRMGQDGVAASLHA